MNEKPLIEALNRMPRAEFVALLGGVFEHSPWVAAAAWEQTPFSSIIDLHAKMNAVVKGATTEQQLGLLRAHPQLAGKAAQQGELTTASTSEQKGAGLTRLSNDEMHHIAQLNQAYMAKFGFPFIIAVRDHDKRSIFSEFERRIDNSDEHEMVTALHQVGLIAEFRLQDLAAQYRQG